MKKILSVMGVVVVLVLGFLFLNDKPRRVNVNADTTAFGIQNSKNLVQDMSIATRSLDQQVIETELSYYGYPILVVEKGTPVKWVMNVAAENLTSCNNSFSIADYQMQVDLVPGENIIEFTPTETGVIDYSCWMGMIRSNIIVVENLDDVDTQEIQAQLASQPRTGRGGCCGD